MILHYSARKGLFWLECSFEERHAAAVAGFQWNVEGRRWATHSPFIAQKMSMCADDQAKKELMQWMRRKSTQYDTLPKVTPAGSAVVFKLNGNDELVPDNSVYVGRGSREEAIRDAVLLSKISQRCTVPAAVEEYWVSRKPDEPPGGTEGHGFDPADAYGALCLGNGRKSRLPATIRSEDAVYGPDLTEQMFTTRMKSRFCA